MDHFKLISTTKASDVIPVNKYVSQKTGLTVIIAEVEGPLVNGFFCLATEAQDDDGLPHTLEHLIFLGSERYPYKGVLDLLANRCMAHGTNAWTDVDHTCYTIYTAGAEGMLSLLPIYLNHILHPTLTEEGFVTEVHHVDGDGEDAGVVYCEMQGRENDAESLCDLQLVRSMYAGSGYAFETGGIMENLRTSTDNVKVRSYHKKFYIPENLTIILTGQIEADDVFKVLGTVEDDIMAKQEKEARDAWMKPWQTMPPVPEYGETKVQWPADTEDCGQVVLGWRGPTLNRTDALQELAACAVLLRYLCETATAPLQRRLVEQEDALAGDVRYNINENLASLVRIQIVGVPVDKLEAARDEAKACIVGIRSGQEPLDMDRMGRLLHKQLRESMASLESDPHHAVAFECIGDALYSCSEADFIARLNPQRTVRELLDKPSNYWLELLQEFFTDDMVIVMGSPSISSQTIMAEEEKRRIEAQRQNLGEAGLKEKAKILQEAIQFNERPPPPGTMTAVPVPSCENLKCHSISFWSSGGEACPHFDLKEMPLYTRLHSLKSNFVYINLVLDLTELDQETRKWLPIIVNSWAECPVQRGDELVPYEAVVTETEQLTVKFDNEIGFRSHGSYSVGIFGNNAHIGIRCEPSDYDAVVNHLWEVLYKAVITKDRLMVFAQRMLSDVSQVRRNGSKIVKDTLRDALYSKDSNMHWCSVLRQQKFLQQLMEQLTAGGDSADAVLKLAQCAMARISENPWLHMATDLERYKLSPKPWAKFAKENEIVPNPPHLCWDSELMSGWGGGFVVGVGGVESNFLVQLGRGPLAYDHPDAAPLRVALNYFTQLEGPMWRLIRGTGLSYGYGIQPVQNEGTLSFSLYKATNVVAAYTKGKSIVEDFLASGEEFEEDLFASAKSTALFEVVENEKCPADVVAESLLNYLRRVGEQYNRDLVCAVASVTPAVAKAAALRWLPTLFNPDQTKLAIVCHPSKVSHTKSAFQKIGIELEAFESIETSHFNN